MSIRDPTSINSVTKLYRLPFHALLISLTPSLTIQITLFLRDTEFSRTKYLRQLSIRFHPESFPTFLSQVHFVRLILHFPALDHSIMASRSSVYILFPTGLIYLKGFGGVTKLSQAVYWLRLYPRACDPNPPVAFLSIIADLNFAFPQLYEVKPLA